MQSLYTNGFEKIYDEMYQTFINYEDEYHFYKNILHKHNLNNVLEIACGTGNLANYFINNKFDYAGLDLSEDMIKLCKKKHKNTQFLCADMTNFKLNQQPESILITGRSTSYLLTNKQVYDCLTSIYNALLPNGILCFDFIDASRFFKEIKGGKKVIHSAKFNQKKYERESIFNTNQSNNFMFDWDAIYYKINAKTKTIIAKDNSEVRAFTRNEWELFLHLSNFELIEIIDKKSYAFDTFVVVAKKK